MTEPMPDQEPQAHSELASFGDELRREREIRGISLKEIADATKISKRFLEAIERNDHRTLPAPVFTRGFVREYARYLGLNCDEMVNRYNFAAAGDDRIEKSVHLDRLVQPAVPSIERQQPKKRGIPPAYARVDRGAFLLIAIVAVLAALAWWAVEHKRAQSDLARHEVSPPPSATAPPRMAPHMTQPVVAAPQPPARKSDEPLRLVVELTDDSWIDLEVDGKTVMRGDYPRGTREVFEAKDNFRFKRIGDAAAVILMLNDKQIPPLGRERQVIKNRVYDRAYLDKFDKQP
ncbi:MAG TPA: helix-turn-helix domain-containing protein [Thermoanaerobaculia bacterium]